MFFDWKVKMRRFALGLPGVLHSIFLRQRCVMRSLCKWSSFAAQDEIFTFFTVFCVSCCKEKLCFLEPLRVEWRELHALDSFHAYWSS